MVISRVLTSGLALALAVGLGYSLNDSSDQNQQLNRENSVLKQQIAGYSNELTRINRSITNTVSSNTVTHNTVREENSSNISTQVYAQPILAEDVPKIAGPIELMIAEFNNELLRNEQSSLINPFIR